MCVTILMTLHTERKRCLMIEDAEAAQFQHYVPYGSRFRIKNGVESCMLQSSTSINFVHRRRQRCLLNEDTEAAQFRNYVAYGI